MEWGAEIVLLIGGALLGLVLSRLSESTSFTLASRRGELTGQWIEVLGTGPHKSEERRDELTVRQRRNGRVTVDVRRSNPESEEGREWRMAGYVQGNDVALVFWPVGDHKDRSSYGVMLMHRDEKSAGSRWRGAYYRPGTDQIWAAGLSNATPIPVEWRRK